VERAAQAIRQKTFATLGSGLDANGQPKLAMTESRS